MYVYLTHMNQSRNLLCPATPTKSPMRTGIPLPELDFSSSNPSSPVKAGLEIPTLPRSDAIPRITGETLVDILNGVYDDIFEDLFIIDCRYSYEFAGGHIHGAVNMNSPELIQQAFFESPSQNSIIVFHCEFSHNRGPQTAALFRRFDRDVNKDKYPQLFYPRIYVLDGGYKKFYNQFPDYCDGGYTPMLDEKHRANGDLIRCTTQFRTAMEQNQKTYRRALQEIPTNSCKMLFQSPCSMNPLSSHSQSPMTLKMLRMLASPISQKCTN